MNIALELPFYSACARGADRFFEGFVRKLAERDKENHYRIFGWWWKDFYQKLERVFCPDQPNFELDVCYWPQAFAFPVSPYLWSRKTNLFFGTYAPRGIPTIMWMTSAGPKTRSNFTPAMAWSWESKILPSMRRTRKIVVPSYDTKREILRTCEVDPDKIVPIYWPASECMRPIADTEILKQTRERYHLPSTNVFLVVGPFDASLKMQAVFQAVYNIRKKARHAIRLVCAGLDEIGLKDLAHKYELDGCIIWTGHLEHEALARLYNIATGCIYPTEYEELGMPLVEAMACGCPVITGKGGALKEAASGAAFHIDFSDIRAIEDCIEIMIRNPTINAECRKMGLHSAAAFTWDIAIEKYMNLFEDVG